MNALLQNLFVTIAALVLVALGLGLCMYLFATCKREISAVRYALRLKEGEIESLSVTFSAELRQLAERVEMAEDRAGVLVPPSPPPSGLNLAKRAQAIRMLSRGTEAGTIATALSLPRPEIALLARVRALAPGPPR